MRDLKPELKKMLNFLPVRKFKRNGKYIVFGAVLMVGFLAAYLELMANSVWSATGELMTEFALVLKNNGRRHRSVDGYDGNCVGFNGNLSENVLETKHHCIHAGIRLYILYFYTVVGLHGCL